MRILGLVLMLFALSSCSLNMEKYDVIIAKVKTFSIAANETKRFRITDFDDVETLEEIGADEVGGRGQGTGLVWVHKTANDLIVYIETEDRGHGGEFGYAYSEAGERPGWPGEEGPSFWSLDEQVDGNWWKVSYLLG